MSLEQVVQSAIDRLGDAQHIIAGPAVTDLEEPGMFYFVLVSGTPHRDCHIDQLRSDTSRLIRRLRQAVLVAVVARRHPVVLHEFDDELGLAKFCETIWPEKFASIREHMEAERAPRH